MLTICMLKGLVAAVDLVVLEVLQHLFHPSSVIEFGKEAVPVLEKFEPVSW